MARILIAEDDEIVAELVANYLFEAGHAVGILETGSDALQAIRARVPDIVILDANLPEMHGVNVLRAIRGDRNLWHLPVLMFTANRGRGDEEIAMHAGADGYLRKPCDPEYLLFRIEQALQEQSRFATPQPPVRRIS